MARKKIIIAGAGPAGLAAAYELCRLDQNNKFEISIYETENQIGGIAKTLNFKGSRFDLGGHRFYSKFPEINQFYQEFLGKEMLVKKRLSRIYYKNKFFNYPLNISNTVKNLGLIKSIELGLSWIKRQINPYPEEKNFKQWVANRFGDKLFEIFFKSYTEKTWGISTNRLSADWAAQRIQNFNFLKAVLNACFKINLGAKTIIDKFYYPKYGPGMLYEKMAEILKTKRVKIKLCHQIIGLKTKRNRIVEVVSTKGKEKTDYFISTLPLNDLARMLKQKNNLKFRSFITVNFVIKTNPFPDQWIYIHDPKVKVARIQNFRNWSQFMVKKSSQLTPIGMEYFCNEGDDFWSQQDKEILYLAKKELTKIGLVETNQILNGFVYRVKNAYPIYDLNYKKSVEKIRKIVAKYKNLYLCGRGGLFRYNNQDHSILTGFFVARNIVNNNKKLNVWAINNEEKYIEAK